MYLCVNGAFRLLQHVVIILLLHCSCWRPALHALSSLSCSCMSLYELEMPMHTVVAQKLKQSLKHTTGTTAAHMYCS